MDEHWCEEAEAPTTTPERLWQLVTLSRRIYSSIAANPGAPPALLAELAEGQDSALQQHLLQNPNTPKEVLLRLGRKYPETLLQNPALPLLYLEDPGLFSRFPPEVVKELLERKDAPRELLEYGARHPRREIRLLVAKQPGAPAAALLLLARDKVINIRNAILRNPGAPAEALAVLAEEHHVGGSAADAETSRWVRIELAMHPNTPPTLLAVLAVDTEPEVRRELASRQRLPLSLLEQLAMDPDAEVRQAAAAHADFPASLLSLLQRAGSGSDLSYLVVPDPTLEPETLVALADRGVFGRRLVGRHPATPKVLLARLAEDGDEGVRWAVAENIGTPHAVIARLSKDPHLGVQQSAKRALAATRP
jgi:hypothetical protein